MIQIFFEGIGNITEDSKENTIHYKIYSIDQLSFVIKHFDLYPLYTQKQADYILFKQIYELIKNKQHLNEKGFKKIVMIRASINLGLSNALKSAFPDILAIERPKVRLPANIDPN